MSKYQPEKSTGLPPACLTQASVDLDAEHIFKINKIAADVRMQRTENEFHLNTFHRKSSIGIEPYGSLRNSKEKPALAYGDSLSIKLVTSKDKNIEKVDGNGRFKPKDDK